MLALTFADPKDYARITGADKVSIQVRSVSFVEWPSMWCSLPWCAPRLCSLGGLSLFVPWLLAADAVALCAPTVSSPFPQLPVCVRSLARPSRLASP
jgi:hypothetical protein